jgi:hypothetical protein
LVDFFTTKFPELQKNEFYITGESYAGVYIPTLTKEILDHPSSKGLINLKGVAVGDPCTDNDAQKDSMDPLVSTLKVLCCCVLNVCCVVMVDILMVPPPPPIFSIFCFILFNTIVVR